VNSLLGASSSRLGVLFSRSSSQENTSTMRGAGRAMFRILSHSSAGRFGKSWKLCTGRLLSIVFICYSLSHFTWWWFKDQEVVI
jgi:hypothetical protein